MLLRQGWNIQSSADVREAGAALSTPGYRTRGWYRATLPSTVFSALVEQRVYPDPYYGMNLRSTPGVSYPIASNFSNTPMPPDSPFRKSWWYRTDFKLPAEMRGRTIWLGFDGINFRANVWLNGRQLADADKMAGSMRLFEFDATAAARPGGENALAVEIFPPDTEDLAITFVDWNPQPPDKNMGLWRDVYVHATGPVAIRYPSIATKLQPPAAEITVRTELKNASASAVEGVLRGKIEGVEFAQPVRLAARETRLVRFTPDRFAQLRFANPRLWWPVFAGAPNLYPLELRFEINGQLSDSSKIDFGIREITAGLDDQGHRLYKINGKNILIRGAGYSFDMLLRSTPEKQDAHLRYVRDMNLNAIRFEGKMEDDRFMEQCDRLGILVMAGWCCCDHWEHWPQWDPEDEVVAVESQRDQLRRLARFASVFDWLYASDNPPPEKIEKLYLGVIKETEWTNPYLSSATAKKAPVTGDTGVKMAGPYDYVPPSYWLADTKHGGAHGFNTETSPGPAPMNIESLRRTLPEEHLWPINSWWDFHAGGGQFRNLRVFNEAMSATYGAAESLEDYSRKAQVMAYDGHRAMFEAFGRNKYTATGVIQWMLNNAWPGNIWHLYDWYMRPGGSYFGAKKANEPLHVQYSYDDRSVVVVNSFYEPHANLKVSAKVYNFDMSEKLSRDGLLSAGPDSATRVFMIPEIAGLSPTYFVSLSLADSAGKVVSRNFYWLSSARQDRLEFEKTTWYYTPTAALADLRALNLLPRVELKIDARTAEQGTDRVTRVTVTNPGRALAFSVRLKVNRGKGGDEVLPVLWEDNYFSLLPGESREVAATYRASDLGKAEPVVEVEGWNVR